MPESASRKAASKKWRAANREHVNERSKRWRAKNRKRLLAAERVRRKALGNHGAARRHRLRQYGLTPETFEAISVSQKHRCAICRRKRPLCVDHNHRTGNVRGLLCQPCNTGLGLFSDRAIMLDRAARYLLARHAS